MTAVMLFNRHCESQARKPGLARQRAVLARVTAHMSSQSAGRAGLGTGVHRAFFSVKTVSWLSTYAINAALKSGWQERTISKLTVSSSNTGAAGGIWIAEALLST
jgi:hypothetical protein